MPFHFADKSGDPLMTKINLRQIESYAKQWDHPIKGLLAASRLVAQFQYDYDLLKTPKNVRELYCVALAGLAFMKDTGFEWWVHLPETDPPDGLIMTLSKNELGVFMGYIREVEVVEHRGDPDTLLETISKKLRGNSYTADTILVCLILTSGEYDLKYVSEQVRSIQSKVGHVFVVFAGAEYQNRTLGTKTELVYSMVQLGPVFEQSTFSAQPYIEDFFKKFDLGQESRLITGKKVEYATSNTKAVKAAI